MTPSPATRRATTGTPTPDSGGALLGILQAIRKHWTLVAACVLLASGLALLYGKSQRKIYQASSMLEINPHAAQPLGDKGTDALEMGAGLSWDTREYYETQYRIITSERVLSAVVRDLSLTTDYDFFGLRAPPAIPITVEDAANALRGRVSVDPVKYSRLVVIHAEDTDPKRAKRVCDAVAAAYIEQNLGIAVNSSSDAVVWLSGQLDHVKQDLEHNENALYEFKQRNDLPSTSINEASNMLRLEMQELDTSLTHTRTKKQEAAARFAELTNVSPDDPDQLPASELLASPFLQSIRMQYQDALKERASLVGEGKGDNHPLVKKANERVATAKTALLSEVRNIQGAVERDLAIITRQEAGEAALFDAVRRRAVDLNMKEIEYHRLDRALDQNEKLYDLLRERLKESDLARMMKVNNVRVVDSATEPKGPIRPNVSVNVGMGIFVGLLLGVGLAWLRQQLDNSVKTPDDLEQKLGVTFLGLLPELQAADVPRQGRRRRRGSAGADLPADEGPIELVVQSRPLSGIAEAARSIRTNLIFMNPDRPYRKVLVTSAAPSEGKTTVACSIAVALAQGGQRVCIVDCDLRRPRLHRIFNRAGDAGVTNVIVGETTVDDVAKPTGIPNLWSIPAGPTPPNPADLLHSERFRKFIEDLSERFDRVIIDSPPLVAVTDSAIISTLVDGTIFVVRAFKTSKHISAQGLRALRDVDAPVIGAVLNAVNVNRNEYSYYYRYYYYKREGYLSTQPAAENESRSAAPPPH
ncbi:MAG: polysaccharide biosynthesis tyrosine autokinase [Myxococcota bacterium]|nr:polysaccharide biosynthesis tyrosine autokinase [Myxococcota bacterium]